MAVIELVRGEPVTAKPRRRTRRAAPEAPAATAAATAVADADAEAGEAAATSAADADVEDVADEELMKLRDWIDATYQIEGDLRLVRSRPASRRKVEIGCYQGIRHRRGLPVHGQRTQTNARTRKGKKKTDAGKKKAGKK